MQNAPTLLKRHRQRKALRLARWAVLPAALLATTPASAADYVVITREIAVERPADAVWARIGGYCAIGEWLKVPCAIVSGSGGVGTIRRIGPSTLEPMVAATPHSYTYSQIAGGSAGIDYHGTLAVEPLGPKRARIVYTVVYDRAAMPSDEVRQTQFDLIGARFQKAVETMKQLAEAK